MAVVSVSLETDTTATNRELPRRANSTVHESCPVPRLSSAARRRVRLSRPRARSRGCLEVPPERVGCARISQ